MKRRKDDFYIEIKAFEVMRGFFCFLIWKEKYLEHGRMMERLWICIDL